jgi:hypothetical protein
MKISVWLPCYFTLYKKEYLNKSSYFSNIITIPNFRTLHYVELVSLPPQAYVSATVTKDCMK